ncbi:hypothetical protein Cni_G08179 [Canna indica]|uniref:Uncharacterized protein n=1 Tax=Canna indica TaxID=4628 RepID=A0AAQ3K2E3_9LILI|nr:hypothetical protein Cni_G08179 [Canna indica]
MTHGDPKTKIWAVAPDVSQDSSWLDAQHENEMNKAIVFYTMPNSLQRCQHGYKENTTNEGKLLGTPSDQDLNDQKPYAIDVPNKDPKYNVKLDKQQRNKNPIYDTNAAKNNHQSLCGGNENIINEGKFSGKTNDELNSQNTCVIDITNGDPKGGEGTLDSLEMDLSPPYTATSSNSQSKIFDEENTATEASEVEDGYENLGAGNAQQKKQSTAINKLNFRSVPCEVAKKLSEVDKIVKQKFFDCQKIIGRNVPFNGDLEGCDNLQSKVADVSLYAYLEEQNFSFEERRKEQSWRHQREFLEMMFYNLRWFTIAGFLFLVCYRLSQEELATVSKDVISVVYQKLQDG